MAVSLIHTLSYIMARSPPSARAIILNGWPNRGLAKFETLCGAREELAIQEQRARREGELAAPRRPFVEEESNPVVGNAEAMSVRGLETLRLVAAKRLTGFADHAHHMYIFSHKVVTQGEDK